MNTVTELFTSLSPEKRSLLEKQLLKKNLPAARKQSAPRSDEPRPLSSGQKSLWFLDQLETNSPLYNLPRAWRLCGPLNLEALRKSFQTIVGRHEALRTRFIPIDDAPMQIVAENKHFALTVFDLTNFAVGERKRELERRMDEEAKRPFDLARDVLLRATLFRCGSDENVLCVSVHHIAADAWSLDLLSDELTALYGSFCAGEPSALPKLDFQYSDFALCQQERRRDEVVAKQIAYWKERLAGELPVLELPTDRPRGSKQTFRGAQRYFAFPNSVAAAVKELSRRENVTVYSTLLAAFQILLHRYSRQDDILVGTPVGTRNSSDTEKLIGYFINTVVLRSDLSGNPVFRELLQHIHRNVLGALSHQDVSLEQLARELQAPRHPGRNPIIQVLFQHLAMPMKLPQFSGIAVEMLSMETHASQFDLSLTLRDSPEGLLGEFEYNTDLFDAETMDRMAGHYQTLLQAIVENPARKIASLPILPPAEERRLLVEWNATEISFPMNVSIPVLLEKQVEATPDAVAVRFEKEQLTWRELNARANRLARYLKKLGVQPDTFIGICMERSIEMLVAVHGVLKSGAAYLPLDPEYPAERLSFMLKDAQVPVLLTQKRLAENTAFERSKVVCLDEEWGTIAGESAGNLFLKPKPDRLAYLIYTSGSTGQPKGVMISHGSICNHLFWMQNEFPLMANDRILQKTSFSFDVAVWELLAPVVTGAALVMAKPDGHRDSAYLAEFIADEKITILQTVPLALRALLEEPGLTTCHSLKYVICGGEEMPADLVERFSQSSNAQLSNSYGPTEACIDTTSWVGPHQNKKIAPPIGRPIANAEVYILDVHLHPVPIGVPGELCVGGRGLARGYWRRPELTAEKFIPHPFSKKAGARLYKTGDLARFRPDGNIEFLGRIDQQVKVRGFRIELGEIEAALKSYPGISQTVVAARSTAAGENRLVAYLVSNHSPAPADAALRAFLKTRLPDYMVPSAFVSLDTLPLNPNGKLDRMALPEPDYHSDISLFVAPRTTVERELAQIWGEILGLKQVGIHDNFFELGGHSLLAAQILARMKRAGRVVAMRDFFQSPTVAGISSILEKNTGVSHPAITPITPLARSGLRNAIHILGLLFNPLSAEVNLAPEFLLSCLILF